MNYSGKGMGEGSDHGPGGYREACRRGYLACFRFPPLSNRTPKFLLILLILLSIYIFPHTPRLPSTQLHSSSASAVAYTRRCNLSSSERRL